MKEVSVVFPSPQAARITRKSTRGDGFQTRANSGPTQGPGKKGGDAGEPTHAHLMLATQSTEGCDLRCEQPPDGFIADF